MEDIIPYCPAIPVVPPFPDNFPVPESVRACAVQHQNQNQSPPSKIGIQAARPCFPSTADSRSTLHLGTRMGRGTVPWCRKPVDSSAGYTPVTAGAWNRLFAHIHRSYPYIRCFHISIHTQNLWNMLQIVREQAHETHRKYSVFPKARPRVA